MAVRPLLACGHRTLVLCGRIRWILLDIDERALKPEQWRRSLNARVRNFTVERRR